MKSCLIDMVLKTQIKTTNIFIYNLKSIIINIQKHPSNLRSSNALYGQFTIQLCPRLDIDRLLINKLTDNVHDN